MIMSIGDVSDFRTFISELFRSVNQIFFFSNENVRHMYAAQCYQSLLFVYIGTYEVLYFSGLDLHFFLGTYELECDLKCFKLLYVENNFCSRIQVSVRVQNYGEESGVNHALTSKEFIGRLEHRQV